MWNKHINIQNTPSAGKMLITTFILAMIFLSVVLLHKGLYYKIRSHQIRTSHAEIMNALRPIDLDDPKAPELLKRAWALIGEIQALKQINLDVGAGEILALVGMSGGGKTSLVNLIPRFFDVSGGRILIDDTDIRDASIKSLRKQIAIVTQETILFNDTIRNNIAYGRPEASEDEIISAAKAAYAYDFVQNFPKGFDTVIGELGGRLSGGEKQRLCIARALIKDAPILILDEATSALDTESEMLVQKALENLMKGRTTFVIAHRLSTIAYAHRIVVIVNGQIIEMGTHEELMARQGEYFKLYQMQFSGTLTALPSAESSAIPAAALP